MSLPGTAREQRRAQSSASALPTLAASHRLPDFVEDMLFAIGPDVRRNLVRNPSLHPHTWEVCAELICGGYEPDLAGLAVRNPAFATCPLDDLIVGQIIRVAVANSKQAPDLLFRPLAGIYFERPTLAAAILDDVNITDVRFLAAATQPASDWARHSVQDRLRRSYTRRALDLTTQAVYGPIHTHAAHQWDRRLPKPFDGQQADTRWKFAAALRVVDEWTTNVSVPRASLALIDMSRNPRLTKSQRARLQERLDELGPEYHHLLPGVDPTEPKAPAYRGAGKVLPDLLELLESPEEWAAAVTLIEVCRTSRGEELFETGRSFYSAVQAVMA